MQNYTAKDMARSFRTVRANTIRAAEEIPADQYGFRPAPGVRTVAETLAHLVVGPRFAKRFQSDRPKTVDFAQFAAVMEQIAKEEAELKTKDQILGALRAGGDEFASWLEGLSDEMLDEQVHFPPQVQPPVKTRFEILLSAKEHEMHHRAQLMVVERMLGIVPHLTREFEQRRAELMKQTQAAKSA